MIGHTDMPRAAEVRPAESLGELAAVANRAAEAGAENLRVAGEALLKARKLCRHGEWLPWLKKNIRFSPSHAAKLMKAARSGERPERILEALSEPAPEFEIEPPDFDSAPVKCGIMPHLTPPQSSPFKPKPAPARPSVPPPPVAGPTHRPNDQEAARLLVGHVPADPDATVPGEKARGPLLVKIVSDALASARKLREDVDLYHAHHGGFPGPDDVRPIVAALEQARKECEK